MLTGEYRHNVDPKNRLFIPAKHREELGNSFMIVKDVRGPRLKIYSMGAWEAYIAPIRSQERRLAEAALRFLHKDAVTAEPDSQGRVVLTPTLLAYAGIKKEAVIIGCADYAEIWDAEQYDREMAAEDPEALRAALEALGL
ncbi:MAG: division/cell wall cluster transcriptional repressor MraZ [Clostridia bacterium]|nr:division/cell wall cluster transcriptional repressor MraZ [Clostridia bacterium]